MEKTYNGRPLRAGFVQNFSRMSLRELQSLKDDLGLSCATETLDMIRKKTVRPEGKITTDELYMADAFLDTAETFADKYSFAEVRCNNDTVKEAFSDLMNKRRALGFALPVDHVSLVDVYSKYLICAGYDSKKVRPRVKYTMKEKFPSGMLTHTDGHVYGSCFGCEESNVTIGVSDAKYRFNTDKERIYPTVNGGMYHLLLVKLPAAPLAFEQLANIIHSNARLSKDIIYCAPVGRAGLFTALLGTSHGYVINIDTVSALMGEELRPYDLTLPMNCALLLVPADVSQSIALSILDFGYGVRFVGHTSGAEGSISVLYQGLYHTVDAKMLRGLIPNCAHVLTLDNAPSDKAFLKSVSLTENVSLTVFSHLTFEEIYEALRSEAEKLSEKCGGERIYAYVAIPTVTFRYGNDHAQTLTELLGIYKALAERAIPIVKCEFIPSPVSENASVFLVCDKK